MRQSSKLANVAIIALIMNLVAADSTEATWDYSKHGEDWGKQFPKCSYPIQSPVDLKFDWESYGQQTPENPDDYLKNWEQIPFTFFSEMFETSVGTSGFKN